MVGLVETMGMLVNDPNIIHFYLLRQGHVMGLQGKFTAVDQ